jgi:hypothetical protein
MTDATIVVSAGEGAEASLPVEASAEALAVAAVQVAEIEATRDVTIATIQTEAEAARLAAVVEQDQNTWQAGLTTLQNDVNTISLVSLETQAQVQALATQVAELAGMVTTFSTPPQPSEPAPEPPLPEETTNPADVAGQPEAAAEQAAKPRRRWL